MRQNTCLSRLLLILCLPLLWSCAAHQSDNIQSQLTEFSSDSHSDAASHPKEFQGQEDPEQIADDSQDDDLSPIESEATASQEIQDLEKLGSWEGSATKYPDASKVQSDFPIVINRQVEYYLDLFQNGQRKIFASWLARSTRYLPMMRQELAAAGLPQDLVYLSMIESGFKPNAFSRASAVGLWQFMAPTATRFGLQVNKYIDERRDAALSTKAAIAYLSDLYAQFGNWYMAIAAYNAGEGKISKGVQKFNCTNFWDLAEENYLALETKRYVPQMIAAIIISKSPKQFGFDDIPYEKPLSYETAKVPANTSLQAVAVATNTDVATLHDLNRQLSKGVVPPGVGSYELKLPVGAAPLVAANLPRVHATVSTQFKDHVIGSKDTINKICAKYGIDKLTLMKANNLRKAKLVPGNILRIPYQTTQYAMLSEKELKQLADSAKRPEDVALHTVKKGETLSQIATRYGTSAQSIASWNNLKSGQKLQVGQQLTLHADEASSSSGKQSGERLAKAEPAKEQNREIVATKTKTPAKAKESEETTLYQVQSGDNLWKIAQRFDLDPSDLKKWNKLETNDIAPGLKLIIKSKS